MTLVTTASAPTIGSRVVDGVAKWGFVAVTALLIVFFFATQPAFGTVENIFGMLKFIAPVGIAGTSIFTFCPSVIIDPLPNAFSIWDTAWLMAFCFS